MSTTEARLRYHPLSNYLPRMGSDEFAQLVASIREHGLREPIVLYEDMILDGRNRYEACLRAEREPKTVEWDGEGDPLDYVRDKNLRRHMTQAQRREVIIALLSDHSHRSDRWIASWAGVSHNTVRAIRARMEGGGQIDHHETRVGQDEVEQPATKPQRPSAPERQPQEPRSDEERVEVPPTPERPLESRVEAATEPKLAAPVRVRPFRCADCDAAFPETADLQAHRQNAHPTPQATRLVDVSKPQAEIARALERVNGSEGVVLVERDAFREALLKTVAEWREIKAQEED